MTRWARRRVILGAMIRQRDAVLRSHATCACLLVASKRAGETFVDDRGPTNEGRLVWGRVAEGAMQRLSI